MKKPLSGAFLFYLLLPAAQNRMETQRLFQIGSALEFDSLALEVFRFQYHNNPVYREFCDHLGTREQEVDSLSAIPFLPIEFFKQKDVLCRPAAKPKLFTSSGTSGSNPSRHYVADISLYEESFNRAFELFYGPVTDYCILALLPSYLEREGSSLIYMVSHLIHKSRHPDSGFYLHDLKALKEKAEALDSLKTKVLLIGVSFALLDFVARYTVSLKHTIIMETGGMKGRKKEMVREELHSLLKAGFGVDTVHSEYGMTELLSQAYSVGNGQFSTPPWMAIRIREPEDPFALQAMGKTGGLNVIDLANVYSCSFIATQDLGKMQPDNRFEVLGRFDDSDIRGCNLMVM